MKTIKQKYLINASLEKVWKALTDAEEICGWGACPAKMDDKKGTEFKLWGGDVYGKNIEVIPQKKLVQDWQYKGWEKASKVTFNLCSKNGKTEVELIHEDVPDSEHKDIDQGWKDYYLGSIKKYLE